MLFGERLRHLRESKGLEREELAKILNLGYHAIAKYENNERFPSQDTLVKIADFFKVSIDYLLGRSNTQQTSDTLLKLDFGRADDPFKDIPEDAMPSVYEFLDYIRQKYGKKPTD